MATKVMLSTEGDVLTLSNMEEIAARMTTRNPNSIFLGAEGKRKPVKSAKGKKILLPRVPQRFVRLKRS
ncbi:hypothetical protein V6N13_025485 [Hibiscus sabdariffa]